VKKIQTPKKIFILVKTLSQDRDSRLLKKYSRGKIPKVNSKSQILVEFELPPDSLFGAEFFLPTLAKELDANCVAYQMTPQTSFWRIKRKLYFHLSSTRKLIGKRFVYFRASGEFDKVNERAGLPKSKEEALNYHYKEIRIGDLAYDWYLTKYHEPTVKVSDPRFELLLQQFESYVDQLLEYLKSHSVAAICLSHSVYHFAIPARIGIKLNIPVYQISLESIFSLDAINQIAYANEKYFPEQFRNIDQETKQAGIIKAKERLSQRISGAPGVDMAYMSTSAFARSNEHHSVPVGSSEIKVLIAAHDFYDAPHIFGDFFYPDFLEWINALIRISKNCNYEWYIKTHPFLRGDGRELLKEAIRSLPSFTLLPQTMSHHEVIELGVTHALTVYGSIAHEYPILGIPVINAHLNNPHNAYNFSFTPKSREEYEKVLLNLSNFSYKIDPSEIFEFYFMKNLHKGKSWLIADYDRYVKETGFPQNQVTRKVFSYLLLKDQLFPIQDIENRIINFLRNGSYMIDQPS
jgi:hypothetical protein